MILVTGASGNTGREVVTACQRLGLDVVAGDRSGRGRRFDFTDAATWKPALEGCDQVFLLRPPAVSDVEHTLNPFIDLCVEQGVKHVVFLSVQGAEARPRIPHHAVEKHLEATRGLTWTMLRPGFFAQNFSDAYRTDIITDSRLYVPAGEGRVAFVDLRDLGELAARIFAAPAVHASKGYWLTGPQTFTFGQASAVLGEVLGHTVPYVAASVPGYLWHLVMRRRLPLMQAVIQTYLHTGLRHGDAEQVDPTLGLLLGRPARGLDQFLRDCAAEWRAPVGKVPEPC